MNRKSARKLEVDLIIFDLDMTLVDSLASINNCFVYAFERNGLPPPAREDVNRLIGLTLEKMTERLLLKAGTPADMQKAIVDGYRERYRATAGGETKLFPGVRDVLEHFKGKRLAVVTTKHGGLARKLLEELDILRYFNLVLGYGDFRNPKPDPESIFKALDETKVHADRAVIVGDTIYDIEAGKGAGIHTVAVTFGVDSREELELAKPEFMIDNMRELMDIIV